MGKTDSKVTVETFYEKIDKLIANDLNPRITKDKGYQELKKSLSEFPEMKQLREIVVDETMTILGGHQRIYALKELGYDEVLVKKVTGFTPRQKREFMIKDNNHSGEWDSDKLANKWDIDELKDWGVPAFTLGEGDEDKQKKEPKTRSHNCQNCGEPCEG